MSPPVSGNSSHNASVQSIPTPAQIVHYLDQYVRGQAEAKRTLAIAKYFHLFHHAYRQNPTLVKEEGLVNDVSFKSSRVLMVGTSGSGKTYLAKLLANLSDLGFSFIAATSLVQTGYIGTSIDRAMELHYLHAGSDKKRAEKGIIFIDEIDKVRARAGVGIDVSGEGVQNALLTVLDGCEVKVGKESIDTSGILFICTGAFAAGLPNIVRARFAERGDRQKATLPDAELLAFAETEDFVKFGLIPELVSRITHLTTLAPLTKADLIGILEESKDSALQQKKAWFALHGIELKFTPEALDHCASQAARLGTGARALTRIISNCLFDWEFQLPDLQAEGVRSLTITHEMLVDGQQPLYTYHHSTHTVSNDDTSKRTDADLWERITDLKYRLGWADAAEFAKTFWELIESTLKENPETILRFCEALLARGGLIDSLCLAVRYHSKNADVFDFEEYLACLDFWQARRNLDRSLRHHTSSREEGNDTKHRS